MIGALLSLTHVGCGPSLTPVTGTVKVNGEPINEGSIVFTPMAAQDSTDARIAIGPVQADGSYTLKSSANQNGAAPGKYKVSYLAPDPVHDDKNTAKMIQSQYAAMIPRTIEVEVKSGPNIIDIELVKNANYIAPGAKSTSKGTGRSSGH
jgi:hypothetical protein